MVRTETMKNVTPANERIELALDDLEIVSQKVKQMIHHHPNNTLINTLRQIDRQLENVLEMLLNGY